MRKQEKSGEAQSGEQCGCVAIRKALLPLLLLFTSLSTPSNDLGESTWDIWI
jgi:hypothetical protein